MTWDGFFPEDLTCNKCGVILNKTDRPAELYAGTYTGLCYSCQNVGVYVLSVSNLDGARKLSYPPHCPSWRRDREQYIAYIDCDKCGGAGMKMIYTHLDRYPEYCKDCNNRYYNESIRKRYYQRIDKVRNLVNTMLDSWIRNEFKIKSKKLNYSKLSQEQVDLAKPYYQSILKRSIDIYHKIYKKLLVLDGINT